MLCRVLGILSLTLALVSSAEGSILVTTTPQPTPGLAGFTTWTIGLSTNFDQLSTIDAKFTGAVLNQINPFGLPTIFQDNNAVFGAVPGANVLQDSQFLFNTATDALLVVPAPTTSEGSTKLTSAFTGFTPFVSRNIAQIVLPTTGSAAFDIVGVTRDNVEWRATGTVSAVPEPSSFVLAGCGAAAVLAVARRRRSAKV